ncbi:MAG TPA: DUF885 domain-containing protein [Terriglobales bacterium]|nr:DUF885 domain-containing protein [Terriglobales bacterium]
MAEVNQLIDRYFDFYFRNHPTAATAVGFHQFDGKLEDFSRQALTSEIAGLKDFQARFDSVVDSDMPADARVDRELVRSAIKARLLELESIQMWRKDPDLYTSSVSYSVFLVMKRNFAPAEERLRAVIARERQIPGVFDAARRNLENPPRIYTEVALQQLPDVAGFFEKDVPAAFATVKDQKLLADFKVSNAGAVRALRNYENFLRADLLPNSKGDFRIGAENYSKKLLYEEMVDVPIDHLLELGYADLRQNQDKLKAATAKIDPSKSPREVVQALQKNHPPAEKLLSSFRTKLVDLRGFIERQHIITIPSQVMPIIEETPAFARALTTASMDTPGPYETKANEGIFNVTLPDTKWKRERTEEWMQGFNHGVITSTAIHEVFPGHYTQFLWVQKAPSKARKLLDCGSNAEGWAHYTEQMMLDEGYGKDDPTLRVGQLQDALLRDARFIAGIEMHTGKMTMEQAKQFFIEQGYQVPPVADVEAKRGTSDPTYLVYTLGKLQIMKLRDDYRKMKGDQFSLLEFHDRFMQQGAVPLKIIRKTMLGDDSPTL